MGATAVIVKKLEEAVTCIDSPPQMCRPHGTYEICSLRAVEDACKDQECPVSTSSRIEKLFMIGLRRDSLM